MQTSATPIPSIHKHTHTHNEQMNYEFLYNLRNALPLPKDRV